MPSFKGKKRLKPQKSDKKKTVKKRKLTHAKSDVSSAFNSGSAALSNDSSDFGNGMSAPSSSSSSSGYTAHKDSQPAYSYQLPHAGSSSSSAAHHGLAPMDLDEDESSPKSGSKKEKFDAAFSEEPEEEKEKSDAALSEESKGEKEKFDSAHSEEPEGEEDSPESNQKLMVMNFDGIHVEVLRDLGLSVAEKGDAKLFIGYLDKLSNMQQRGAKITKGRVVDTLCYFLCGSNRRFGFCSGRGNIGLPRGYALIPYLIFQTNHWNLLEIALDYFHKRLQESSNPQAAKYPKQKLINFIGKALIVYFADNLTNALSLEEQKAALKKLEQFIERYQIDISAKTEAPIPFETEKRKIYGPSSYNGSDPFFEILEITKDTLKPSYTPERKAKIDHILHLTLNFISRLKKIHTIKEFRELLEVYPKCQDINLFWAQNVTLEESSTNNAFLTYILTQDLDKNVIQALLKRGCDVSLPENYDELKKLRQSAIQYGLKDLYQVICQKLRVLNAQYESLLSIQDHPICILMNSRQFDLGSLQWLESELSLEGTKNIVSHEEFYKIFKIWLSDFVLDKRDNKALKTNKSEPMALSLDSDSDSSGCDSESDSESELEEDSKHAKEKSTVQNKYCFSVKDLSLDQYKQLLGVLKKIFGILNSSQYVNDLIKTILESTPKNLENVQKIVSVLFEEQTKEAKEYNEVATQVLINTLCMVDQVQKTDTQYVTKHYKILMMIKMQLVMAGADPIVFLNCLLSCLYPQISLEDKSQLNSLRALALEFMSSSLMLAKLDLNKERIISFVTQYCGSEKPFDIKGGLEFLLKIPGIESLLDWSSMVTVHVACFPRRISGVYVDSNNGGIKHALGTSEADELEMTKLLLSKTNMQFPQEIRVHGVGKFTAFELMFYMHHVNLSMKKAALPQHIHWLSGLSEYQQAMQSADREAQNMLQYDIAVGNIKFDKTLRGRCNLNMAMTLNKVSIAVFQGMGLQETVSSDKIPDLFFDRFKKDLGSIFTPLFREESAAFFRHRYSLGSGVQAEFNLQRMQNIMNSMLSVVNFIYGKREHEIWQMKTLRAFSFISNLFNHPGVKVSSQTPSNFEKRILANIYAIMITLAKQGSIKELIECLLVLDDHYYTFSQGKGRMNEDLFIKYLYRLSTSLPHFKYEINLLSIQLLQRQVIQFYRSKLLTLEKETQDELHQNAKKTGCLDLSFIEKYKSEFYNSIDLDIKWGYIQKEGVETLLNQPLLFKMYNIFEVELDLEPEIFSAPILFSFESRDTTFKAKEKESKEAKEGKESHTPTLSLLPSPSAKQ